MKQQISQKSLLIGFFKKNPNKNISHPEIVDIVTKEYKNLTGKVFRDPDRGVRKLHQEGFLVKVKKGVYKYDPNLICNPNLEDFTPALRDEIFKRDDYRCVICGMGKKDGVDIQADHIKPKDKGGRAILENGQTLCAPHNFRKKNYKQTETGKKMFIRLYELAKKTEDNTLLDFCKDILSVFDKHNINGHIEWEE